jgi:serine protease DegQ
MASLMEFSDDLAALVERAGASVVRVIARRGHAGSGIVWSAGTVVTANHVIENDERIDVESSDGSGKALILGRDPGTDLALLQVDDLTAPAASPADVHRARIGHLVLALARPSDLHATIGVISSLSASFRSWRGGEIDRLIQTDAQLLPGFSGGPLIDLAGRVLGVNSWTFGRGISRSIPLDTVGSVVRSLQAHGRIRRAYLGLGTQPVRLADGVSAKAGQESGLLVIAVEADGPAGQAGVLQGDTVVAIDGSPVRALDDLFALIRGLEVGSDHALTVLRAGDLKALTVTVGEREG